MSQKPESSGVRLRVLFVTSQWPTNNNPAAAPFVKREAEMLSQAGVDVDVLVYDGGWSPLNYLRAIRDMRKRIRQNKYSLIHARFGQCGLVARAQRRLPVIITYGGSDIEGSPTFIGFNRYRNYVLIAVSRLLSLIVDEVIVVSDHLGRKLPRRHYHVISSGLDLEMFKPHDPSEARDILNLPKDKKLVLFVGNPTKQTKRFDLATKVCELAGCSVDLELVLLYQQPPSIVPVYMSACDALLLTSTNEGSPNVVKEALACNLPVVSTNVGDVKERLSNSDICEVLDDDNPDIIAEALIRVLKRPGKPSLRHLVEALDQKWWATQVKCVYQQAISKRL